MKPIRYSKIINFAALIIMVSLFAGCSSISTTTTNLPPAPQTTEETGNLSQDAAATLRSLEKLDEYPFYVMQYQGDYPYPRTLSFMSSKHDFSCSLFASFGGSGEKLYGRNFDWEYSPSLLLFTNPMDGFASASMVDLGFLDITPAEVSQLTDLPITQREGLLSAPAMPFDGMNEYGLVVGMAAVPDEYINDATVDASKPTIGSIGIMRQVLDHARNIQEAVAIFGNYNIDFSGGPAIHYLLAEPGGKAVLVEFYRGEMVLINNQEPWHLATNHMRCIAQGDGGCWRYHTISDRLTTTGGQLNSQTAMQLLSDVKQESTQWSTVYNMATGEITVVIGQDYQKSYSFQLEMHLP